MANNLSDFTVIEVIPTLQATAYTTGRMAFVTTEIPNAVTGSKGCSKLIGLTIVNKADATFLGDIIFQSASTTHGAINAAPGMSVGDLASAGVLGTIKIETEDWTDFGAGQVACKLNSDVLNTVPFLLQAESGSSSVYFAMIINGTNNPTTTTDLIFRFHIQYR